MKAHLEKFMNVSDMQVPDEDDRIAEQPPPYDQSEQQDRERANVDARQPFGQQDCDGANLDHLRHKQDCGTAFGTRH